ncbi:MULTISPECIES: GNAT family N-acetyltransferase [unclassified Fredinandcohnia]|uniref:GNAT family N-acetyltransferase n=1 Tax=unclassified Fredinandcohnia TaxID=2837514 RepID=UPI0030FDC900
MDVDIRRPKIEDKDELHRFFKDVIMDTFSKEGIAHLTKDIVEEIETKKSYLQSDFTSAGKNRYFLLATYENTIVGTIEYGTVSRLICKTHHAYCDLVEVGTVFVHPNYQKQGIGTRLLQSIFTILRDRKIEEFCLDSGYKNAQKYWKNKFGKPDVILKDYWGKNFDHMIWKIQVPKN